jgi:hypothetical protein
MKKVFPRTMNNTEKETTNMSVIKSIFGSILYTHNSVDMPLVTYEDKSGELDEVKPFNNDLQKNYKVVNVNNCVKNYQKKEKYSKNFKQLQQKSKLTSN